MAYLSPLRLTPGQQQHRRHRSAVCESSLLARLQAISGSAFSSASLVALLAALSLVDGSFCEGFGQPVPILGLDDLILPCVALLLHLTLAERENTWASEGYLPDLSRQWLERARQLTD